MEEPDIVSEVNKVQVEDWVFPNLVKSTPTTEGEVPSVKSPVRDVPVQVDDISSLCAESQYIISKLLNLNGFGEKAGNETKTSNSVPEEEDGSPFDRLLSPIPYLTGVAACDGLTELGGDSPVIAAGLSSSGYTVTMATGGDGGVASAVGSVESISSGSESRPSALPMSLTGNSATSDLPSAGRRKAIKTTKAEGPK